MILWYVPIWKDLATYHHLGWEQLTRFTFLIKSNLLINDSIINCFTKYWWPHYLRLVPPLPSSFVLSRILLPFWGISSSRPLFILSSLHLFSYLARFLLPLLPVRRSPRHSSPPSPPCPALRPARLIREWSNGRLASAVSALIGFKLQPLLLLPRQFVFLLFFTRFRFLKFW